MASNDPDGIAQSLPSVNMVPGIDSLDFSELFSFASSPSNQMALDIPTPQLPAPSLHRIVADEILNVVGDDENPEPPDVGEIQRMRDALIAMGIVETANGGRPSITTSIDIGQRERELAEMVLRLTHPALHPIPDQVLDQAATISQLTKQMDILVQRQQEEREFWEAEKTSWIRVAGALTARRFTDGTHRADALERDNLNLMSANTTLREKLQDQQTRVEALEAELRLLKPLLLSQAPTPPRPVAPRPPGRPKKIKEKDEDEFSDNDLNLHHAKKFHNAAKYATTGDARSEHILLASRKLGRQKIAAMLPTTAFPPNTSAQGIPRPNGLPPTNGRPLPLVPPPTLSRNAPPTPGPSQILQNRGPPSPVRPRANPAPTTPHRSNAAAQATPSALDHLINASRILNDADGRSPTRGGGRESVDGSPIKRRRIEEQAVSPSHGGGDGGIGRMMSALDVLAEQAAVVISQSPRKGRAPSLTRSDVESEDDLYQEHQPPPQVSPPRQAVAGAAAKNKGKGKATRRTSVVAMRRSVDRMSGTSNSRSESSLKSPIAIRPSPAPLAALNIPELNEEVDRSSSAEPTRNTRARRSAATTHVRGAESPSRGAP